LPWSVWNILLRFWPVLLIVWGATMILDGKAKTGALTGLVLLALLGVFIISAVVPGGAPPGVCRRPLAAKGVFHQRA